MTTIQCPELTGQLRQYLDTETGLYYLRARYYDPTTAQFLTIDPLVSKTGTPYAYLSGNPTNDSDPTGMCGFWCWVAVGAAVVVVTVATAGVADVVAAGGAGVVIGGGDLATAAAAGGAAGAVGAAGKAALQSQVWNNHNGPFSSASSTPDWTQSVGKVAGSYAGGAYSAKEVNKAIELAKKAIRGTGPANNRNPDVFVDPDTGDICAKGLEPPGSSRTWVPK